MTNEHECTSCAYFRRKPARHKEQQDDHTTPGRRIDAFRIARYVDLPAVEEKFSHEAGDTAEVDVFYGGYHYALLRYKGYGNTYVRRV